MCLLTEIWFDGGYEGSMKESLLAVLTEHQPTVVGMNAGGLIKNAVRWVGTEGDMGDKEYPDGVWSTYCCNSSAGTPCVVSQTDCSLNSGPYGGAGCPATGDSNNANRRNSASCDSYYPAGLDYTLQAGDVWFFEPNAPLRPLSEMITVYHNSVGRNTVLELDFAIDRTGKVDPRHKTLYAQFGDWIHKCYGTPAGLVGFLVDSAADDPTNSTSVTTYSGFVQGGKTPPFEISIDVGKVAVDRFMIREDLSVGERVLAYSVVQNGKTLTSGKAVGNKRIDLLPSGLTVTGKISLQVHSTAADLPPKITVFAAFRPCPSK